MNDLDSLLTRMKGSEPYFADNGFSAAVMACIPTSRKMPLWKENMIMLAATVAGSGIAAWQVSNLGLERLVPDVSITVGMGTFAAATLAVYAFIGATVWALRRDVI